MGDRHFECQITVPPEKAVGDFANAFRIVHDSGQEWFLDFLVFSESERRAQLVGRVRVHETFLPAVRDRFNVTLQGLSEARAKAQQVVIATSPEADTESTMN